MSQALQAIADLGILPVIGLSDPARAVALAKALCAGGVPAIEVTLRTEGALSSIAAIREACPEMTIGAGTVLNPQQVDQAVAAGASYVVTPGLNPSTVLRCQETGVPIVPGCVTPTELEQGMAYGLSVFKFFPAEVSGGLTALTLLHGPFGSLTFVPTGGITFQNLESYLQKDFVAACGGSYMAPAEEVAEERWAAITAHCRRCMDLSLGFTLAHIGLNHPNETEALSAAEQISRYFRLPVQAGNSSIFAGQAVENMKTPYYGSHGHIGFTANSTRRALAYFRREKIALREESLRYDARGNLVSFYLGAEIGGFAVHVVQKK